MEEHTFTSDAILDVETSSLALAPAILESIS
jgi:hypothetical protein